MQDISKSRLPSDRTLAELGLLFGLLSVAGVGVTMLWPDWKGLGIFFLVVGAVGCVTVIALMVVRLIRSQRVRSSTVLASIGTIMIVAGALIGLVGAFMSDKESTIRSNAKVSALDNTIAFACAWSRPPSHYREDKTLAIADFQGVPISGVDFNRQSAGPARFIRSSEPFQSSDHYSNVWYRCDITNHGSQPIRNLRAKFPVAYSAAVPSENGTRSGDMIGAGFALSPDFDLAPGETDYFYFANASAAFVTEFPPNSVVLQTMADNTPQVVRVVTSSTWQVALMPSPKPLNADTDRAPQ